MNGYPFVTKGYSDYTDYPAQEGGYAYGPEQRVNWYVVETTVERVHVPASRYTNFGGVPLTDEKEQVLKYAPKGRHEGYEQLYDSDYENSSPSRYHEGETLMDNFLNKLHIGKKPPTKTSDLSGPNKYRPSSPNTYHHTSLDKYRPSGPNKYHHTSPGKYRPTSPNKYRPTSPNNYPPTSPIKYRPTSPNKYPPTSPIKYHPTSPNKYPPTNPIKYHSTSPNKYPPTSPIKYRPTSPNKYHPTSPNKYRGTSPNKYDPASPNKYRPTSPNKYDPASPNKYRPTSPNKYHPTSQNKYLPTSLNKYLPSSLNKFSPTNQNKHRPTSPNKYRPTSPDKYQPSSPSKHRPTSLTHSDPSKEAHMVKAQTLPDPNKYRPTSPTKYRPPSVTHNYPSKEDHMDNFQDLPYQNKYRPTSPDHSFPFNEGQSIRTQSFSGPNKNHPSGLSEEGGWNARVVNYSSPNYHWQSAGPPTTRLPLMTPTNDINEALGFLIESANYSPRSNPNIEGAFYNLSPRAQTIEHERRYARPTSGGVTNRFYMRSNAIDSEEAVRRYNGAYVP